MLNKNIRFYSNIEEQSDISGGIRYFFLDSNMDMINKIIVANKIVATTETNLVSDFDDQKKIVKLSIQVIVAIIGIIILIIIISNPFK